MTAYTTTAEDARRFNVRQARREHFARVAEERLGRKRRAPYTRTHYPEDEEFDREIMILEAEAEKAERKAAQAVADQRSYDIDAREHLTRSLA